MKKSINRLTIGLPSKYSVKEEVPEQQIIELVKI